MCRGGMHACPMVLFPASACIGSGHPQRPPVMPFSRIRMHQQSTRGRPPDNPTSVPSLWHAYITHSACTWERTQATRPRKTSPPRGSLVGCLWTPVSASACRRRARNESAGQGRAGWKGEKRASPASPASPAQRRTVTHPHAERPNVKCGPTRRTRRRIGPQLSPARARLELESDMPFAQWGSARATRVAAELARPKLAT